MNQEVWREYLGAQVSVQESPLDREAITRRAGARETASSAKCFQHKDLSSSPETHVTKHGCGSAHICNPSTGRRRLLDPWDQLASQSECANERACLKEKVSGEKFLPPNKPLRPSNNPNQTELEKAQV